MDKEEMTETEKAKARGWKAFYDEHDIDFGGVFGDTLYSEENIRDFIKERTNNVSVLKVRTLGSVVEIYIFVRCSNMNIKAYVKHRLKKMIQEQAMMAVRIDMYYC